MATLFDVLHPSAGQEDKRDHKDRQKHTLAHHQQNRLESRGGKVVCTENLIRVDDVMESPKLTE